MRGQLDPGMTEHQEYQPQFWRIADNAVALHAPLIEHIVRDDEFVALVGANGDEIRGFVTGRLVPTPPVYDSGGNGALIDDFHVASPDLWPPWDASFWKQPPRN